ncbi:MAG: GNAT family N-acetyltransferase [Bacteroidota bacterium]
MPPLDLALSAEPTAQPAEVQALLDQTDWADGRSPDGVARLLATGPYVTARAGGQLIGFARALSDGRYRALIEDVIVDAEWRGRGVGDALVQLLLDTHLSHVDQVHLGCEEANVAFYERFGFERVTGPRMILTR